LKHQTNTHSIPSFLAPSIHRVDSFRELRAARFVYAAGIHPRILKSASKIRLSLLLHNNAEFSGALLSSVLYHFAGLGKTPRRHPKYVKVLHMVGYPDR